MKQNSRRKSLNSLRSLSRKKLNSWKRLSRLRNLKRRKRSITQEERARSK